MPLLYESYSVSPIVTVTAREKPIEVPIEVPTKYFLIGGALAVAGLLFVGLALRRKR